MTQGFTQALSLPLAVASGGTGATDAETARENLGLPTDVAAPNILINGQFRIAQRGASYTSATNTTNNDDNYTLDRWVLLSDGNDVVDVTQETSTVPTGSYSAIKLEVETINKKFGILQILEAKDAEAIIGGNASISFKARNAASDDNTDDLRAALVAWSSTADSVTSDIVSVWENASTNPTLIANWTYENTATANTLTQTYQTFEIEAVSIDTASTANVALFIWCNNTDGALDDAIYITDIKVEKGDNATAYPAENEAELLHKCRRYCHVWDAISGNLDLGGGYWNSTTKLNVAIRHPVELFKSPSVTVHGTTSNYKLLGSTAGQQNATSVSGGANKYAYNTDWDCASGGGAGEGSNAR